RRARPRPRLVQARGTRTAARRPRRRARRQRPSALDARDARALAAGARRRAGVGAGVSRRVAYGALALVAAAPRLAVLLHERDKITASFTEKSDTFAQVFVQHGT